MLSSLKSKLGELGFGDLASQFNTNIRPDSGTAVTITDADRKRKEPSGLTAPALALECAVRRAKGEFVAGSDDEADEEVDITAARRYANTTLKKNVAQFNQKRTSSILQLKDLIVGLGADTQILLDQKCRNLLPISKPNSRHSS